jgi:2-polyprenyl-3-methyl-5-hydroxy-6-metoxy-1,4-benzoquinol methylase
VPDESVSRRSLLRLDFGSLRAQRAPRPDVEPYKAAIAWRWEAGADALLRAWEPLAPVLCDVAGIEPGMRVLDAATGDGNVALEAARRGAAVNACDLAPGQLERARERAEAESEHIIWATSDIEALPDADGTYDVVLSAYGVALAPRPRRAVRELLRVLRPGGLLVLAVPSPRSLTGRVLEQLVQAGTVARPEGIPSPTAWARTDVARERIEAVAPGTEVELRAHPLGLVFASEVAAWSAYAGPFGLSHASRDAFTDLVETQSESLTRVQIEERVVLVLARRPG